jgi:hypothetical protein
MGQLPKKEEHGDVALSVATTFQRMVLGFMPGGHVINEFIDFRSRLFQERILKFSELMKKELEEIYDGEIDINNFSTEEFVDVFEAVIRRVQNTSSEVKLERYKNILFKQIVEPTTEPMILKYVSLLEQINEVQLVILSRMQRHKHFSKVDFIHLLIENNTELPYGEFYYRLDRNNLKINIGTHSVITNKAELDFYVSELVSLGVLNTKTKEKISMMPNLHTLGGNDKIEQRQTEIEHCITPIGIRFINFIKDYEIDNSIIE